jgi:hypothetical protein
MIEEFESPGESYLKVLSKSRQKYKLLENCDLGYTYKSIVKSLVYDGSNVHETLSGCSQCPMDSDQLLDTDLEVGVIKVSLIFISLLLLV